MPAVLKPEAMRWRAALRAAAADLPMPELPPGSSVVLPVNGEGQLARLGFRAAGPQWIRVDMAERMARQAHEARVGRRETAVNPALVTSLGLKPEAVAKLLRDLGFRESRGEAGWVWRGRERPKRQTPAKTGHAFAALADWKRG
jgi:ATP-dependent RNA helicase SUPV3L1/SUV3